MMVFVGAFPAGRPLPPEDWISMLNSARSSLKAFAAALVASVSVCTLVASPAHAGLLVKTATGCSTPVTAQPFARFGDSTYYTLVSNGGLEAGTTDWTVSKASVVSGNETFYVNSTRDTKSLSLPAGSSATTRAFCVGLDKPSMRFFVRSAGTGLLSSLRVDALVETSLGLTLPVPIGTVSPSSAWKPSPKLLIIANLLPLLPGEQTPVAFRFTPQGTGTWSVDDVYVDPHRRV
jgi:hypothetical protein